MKYAFCHFYDKNQALSFFTKDIYTTQEAMHIHILNVQDHFPLECHLEKAAVGTCHLGPVTTSNFHHIAF